MVLYDSHDGYIMQNVTLPAPGKLNLFLHILGRREDGYHNIQTAFQFIDWCDELLFHVRSDTEIHLTSNIPEVSEADNLVVRAASCLQKESGCRRGVDIDLKKRIPMGAGLGGGSSDAATTLLALNVLWETQLSLERLLEIGATLGADVPIFIHGHAAWAEGTGIALSNVILPEPWYVLVIPPIQVSTEALYNDPRLTRDSAALTISQYEPGQGHNDFEKLLRFDHPEIAHALDWLGRFGRARITGSGAVIFAAFDTQEEAGTIAAQVPSSYKAMAVKGLNQSPLHKKWGVAKW